MQDSFWCRAVLIYQKLQIIFSGSSASEKQRSRMNEKNVDFAQSTVREGANNPGLEQANGIWNSLCIPELQKQEEAWWVYEHERNLEKSPNDWQQELF